MILRRVTVTFLASAIALSALGPGAAAQGVGASQALKALAKAELKALKAELAAIAKDIDAAADALVASVASGDVAPLLADLATAWASAHEAIAQAVFERHAAFAQGGAALLEEFQDKVGGDLGGPYPKGFVPGQGGGQDAFAAGWRKELEKTRAKLEARLLKLRKPLEKAGFALGVQVRVPAIQVSQSFDAGTRWSVSSVTSTPGFGVDLLLTLDPLGSEDDGLVLLAGMSRDTDVALEINGADSPLTFEVFADDGRWQLITTSVPEGNYELRVLQGTDEAEVRDSFGVG